jgi:hypothetical protein
MNESLHERTTLASIFKLFKFTSIQLEVAATNSTSSSTSTTHASATASASASGSVHCHTLAASLSVFIKYERVTTHDSIVYYI